MSNAERQRNFQARHPGYDARRKARQRGAVKAQLEWRAAKRRAEAAAANQQALAEAAAAAPADPLSLPAPAVVPALPALNAIAPATEQVAERKVA